MKRVLILIAAIVIVPHFVFAAPDPKPSLTWEAGLGGSVTCNNPVGSGALLRAIAVGSDGNVYGVATCDTNQGGFLSNDVLVVQGFSSSGSFLWSRTFGCELVLGPATECVPGGIAVEPGTDGNVVVCFRQPLLGSVNKAQMVWLDKDDGSTLDGLTGNDSALLGGSGDPCENDLDIPFGVAIQVHNSTALNYYLSDGNSLVGLRCRGYSETLCTRFIDRANAESGESITTAGTIGSRVHSCDNSPTQTVRRVNQSSPSGTSAATKTYVAATEELRWCGRESALNRSNFFVTVYDNTNDALKYEQLNGTTLSSIGGIITPTENTIQGHTALNFFSSDVDGEDAIFYCGSANDGVSGVAAIVKVKTSTAAQSWNITINKDATATTSERIRDCKISRDGSLYVAYVQILTGNVVSQSTIRKYEGAGTGRAPVAFAGFAGTTTTTPFAPGDLGQGVADFFRDICGESTGSLLFCGLILAATVAICVAAPALAVTRSRQTATVAAAGTFAVMAIFNATVGLWETFTTVVLIMTVSASTAYLIRRAGVGAD